MIANNYVPLARLSSCGGRPLLYFPKLWNGFFNPIKTTSNKNIFKKDLILYFLEKLSDNYQCNRLLCPQHCLEKVTSKIIIKFNYLSSILISICHLWIICFFAYLLNLLGFHSVSPLELLLMTHSTYFLYSILSHILRYCFINSIIVQIFSLLYFWSGLYIPGFSIPKTTHRQYICNNIYTASLQ